VCAESGPLTPLPPFLRENAGLEREMSKVATFVCARSDNLAILPVFPDKTEVGTLRPVPMRPWGER
jgi:hypothetical protein